MFIVIVMVVGSAVVFGGALRHLGAEKRHRREYSAAVLEYVRRLDRAEAGDQEAQAWLLDGNYYTVEVGAGYRNVPEHRAQRAYRLRNRLLTQARALAVTEELQPHLDAIRRRGASRQDRLAAAESIQDRLSSIGRSANDRELYWAVIRRLPFGSGGIEEVIATIVRRLSRDLAQMVSAGRDEAFAELHSLWVRYGSHVTDLPDDWNQLVAQKISNPSLADFAGLATPGSFMTGTLRLRAAEALCDQDLAGGKIVLAYCNEQHSGYGKWYQAEVGDYLLGEVAMMVESLTAAANDDSTSR